MNEKGKFPKFTERARKVLALAQEEAQRFQHNYIGTEHLLLGLVGEGEGVAAKVLTSMGVELNQVRTAVEFIIGHGDRIVLGEISLTPRAKKVIGLAVEEAHLLNHPYIGTEHLLLGLIKEGEGIAAGVLESLGLNLDNVRKKTMVLLSISKEVRSAIGSEIAGEPVWAWIDQSIFEFYTFTNAAPEAINFAREEARLLQHYKVGPEHLLAGLLRVEKAITAKVLAEAGADLAAVRKVIEARLGKGENELLAPKHMLFTPMARAILHLAADESAQRTSKVVGCKHIFAGLLRVEQGVIPEILKELGVDITSAYQHIFGPLNPSSD